MSKKQSFLIIGVVILSVVAIIAFGAKNAPTTSSGIVLYFGDTCPHCKELSAYIEKNGIKDKVSFVEKEVFENQTNGQELAQKAKACGFADDNIGVPFLVDNGKCYSGTDQVEKFFNDKISAQSSESNK